MQIKVPLKIQMKVPEPLFQWENILRCANPMSDTHSTKNEVFH